MSNRSDVSPSRGRILDSLSQLFKKKDQEPKATPMMLGKDANFRYDPVKKRHIFLDEPLEDQEEELKAPPKTDQIKKAEKDPQQSDIVNSSSSSLMNPPQNLALNRRKNPAKPTPQLPTLQLNFTQQQTTEILLTPDLKPLTNFNHFVDQQTSPFPNQSEFFNEIPQFIINKEEPSSQTRQRTSSQYKDSQQDLNLKRFQHQLAMNINNLQLLPNKINQIEQQQILISSFVENWCIYHQKDDQIHDTVQQSNLKDTIQTLTSLQQIPIIPPNQNKFQVFINCLQQVQQQDQQQSELIQKLNGSQSQQLTQIIQETQEENFQQKNLIELLVQELNNKESVIASQNHLIQELIVKLSEFINNYDNFKIQIDQLKEDRQQLIKQKQQSKSQLFEISIELKNSRKETEIYQRQLSTSQKEKDSYIKYYEEIKKEMQEDIYNLNCRLEESMNMSTCENHAAIIENSQLKQQIDIYTAENKLLENNYKNHIQLEKNYRQEIKTIIVNDLKNIGTILGISTNFINLDTTSDDKSLEIRKIFFTLQKEITSQIQKKDSENVRELDKLKLQIQSQSVKITQLSGQLSNYHNQLNQYQKLFNDTRIQMSKSLLEKEKQAMQMVRENEFYKSELQQHQSTLLVQQREIGSSQNDFHQTLNNLDSLLVQDKKHISQNNILLEQVMDQVQQYLHKKEGDQVIVMQLESEKRQLTNQLDHMTQDRDNLLQELEHSKQEINSLNEQLAGAEDLISQIKKQIDNSQDQKQTLQQQQQIIVELETALLELTQEYQLQEDNQQQLEARLQNGNHILQQLSEEIIDIRTQLKEKEQLIIDQQILINNYYLENEEKIVEDKTNQINEISKLNLIISSLQEELLITKQNYEEFRQQQEQKLNGQLNDNLNSINQLQQSQDRMSEESFIQLKENDQEKDQMIIQLQSVLQQTTDDLQKAIQQITDLNNVIEQQQIIIDTFNQQIQEEQQKNQQIQNIVLKYQQEISNLKQEKDDLKESQSDDQTKDSEYKSVIENQNEVIQQLSERLSEFQNDSNQEELSSLKVLYAQKMKQIQKMKSEIEDLTNLNVEVTQLRKEIENNEQQLEQSLKERKLLLRQIDEFQNQLDNNSLAQKNKELAQRIIDIEEERLMLKGSLEDIIQQTNEELSKQKNELKETHGQLLQARAQRDEMKAQLNENISQTKAQTPQAQSGVLGKFATFFVTESEMKKISNNK